jgi:autotransporter-associated beta strand protein
MSKNEHGLFHARRTRGLPILLSALLSSASIPALVLIPQQARAQSTWQGGTSSDYNTGSNWSNNTAPVFPGQSAVFDSTSNPNVTVSSAVSPGGWTFTSSAPSYSISGSAVSLGTAGIVDNASGQSISILNDLGGTGGVTASDQGGTLTLSGNNTYTGATVIASGAKLLAGSTSAFSSSSGFTVNGTLDLGAYNNSIGSLAGDGIVTSSNSFGFTYLSVGGTNLSTTFSGAFQAGTGIVVLDLTGGSLTLTGANSIGPGVYIEIDGGTLKVSGLGTLGGANGSLIMYGGTLDLDGMNQSIGAIQIDGGTVQNGTLVTSNGFYFYPAAGTTATVSAVLDDGGAGVIIGSQGSGYPSGTVVLSGNNIYSGTTQINAGTLQVSSDLNLGGNGQVGNGVAVHIDQGDPGDTPTIAFVAPDGTSGAYSATFRAR